MTKILLVEDEESFREGLSFILSKEGYEVITADNGNDAVTQFEQHGADLVLLDVMLPGLSGLEVCKKLLSCLKITLHNDLNYDIFYPLQILFPFILHYDNDEPFIYRKLIQKLNIIMLGDANISNKSAGGSI